MVSRTRFVAPNSSVASDAGMNIHVLRRSAEPHLLRARPLSSY
jgi:hypothetical protein